jgi:glycosyltransferase involved in cell wall biosynthesis
MVSIIIPIFNAEKFIAETINSVIAQSYKNWELLLINDGSTDNSTSIIKKYSRKDERIKYFFQNNSGVSSARNYGIKEAKGDFIFFLDADDCWKPDNIQKRIELLKDKDVYWVFGSIELIDEKSNSLNQTIDGSDENILTSLLLWNGNVITTPSTITVKRECIKNIKFDTNFSTAADQDFAINLAAKYKGKYIGTPTVQYRIVENSMSKNISVMEKDHIDVYKKALKNKLFKNFWFKQKCFSNLYWILAGSWWKDGDNKVKGMYFVMKALMINPFSVFKFLSISQK